MAKLERELYHQTRAQYVSGGFEQTKLFDRSIITLSAGTFGLSLLFIKNIAPDPIEAGYLLVHAWGFFGVCIFLTLNSFLLSQKAYSKQIEILDEQSMENSGPKGKENKNVYSTCTGWLNWFSIGTFIVGVIFLIAFSSLNLLS